MYDDEELARPTSTGTVTHEVIARLAKATRRPTGPEITRAVNAALPMYGPIEARAHKQNIAGLVGMYFWHLAPPAEWLFGGYELHLGAGRVDLVWRTFDDRWLVDEVKTGHAGDLRIARTRQQVQRYLETGRQVWAHRFVGVRLLSLPDPYLSLFIDPHGGRRALHETPYVGTKRR